MVRPSFIDEAGELRPGERAAELVKPLLSAAGSAKGLLADVRRHELAPAAIDGLVRSRRPELYATDEWQEAVEDNRVKGERLTGARRLTESALASVGERTALPPSSLGPLWGHDVDVLVAKRDLDVVSRALPEAGFLDVNPLLKRIGRVTPGVRRFGAVADDGELLASVEVCTRLHPLGPRADAAVGRAERDPDGLPRLSDADTTLRRCLKIAAGRRVSARSVLELLALAERLQAIPGGREIAVGFHRCAELERELAGPGRLTEIAESLGRPRNLRYAPARVDGLARVARRRVRPNRVRVAFSGVDGAGKSTQAELLTQALKRLDVPATPVWVRIGFSGKGLLHGVTALAQRAMPSGSHSAQTDRAVGAERSDHATRRGPLGWSWALVVTVNYLWWLQRLGRRPRAAVVVHDRGLVDALIGLELGYGGALDLGFQRRLITRFVPRADATFYLRLSAEAALERKEDMFAREVLDQHIEQYDRMARELDGVIQLDATSDAATLSRRALEAVLALPKGSSGSG